MGGGVTGSSAGGEVECTADELMVSVGVCLCVCFWVSEAQLNILLQKKQRDSLSQGSFSTSQ